MSQRVTFSSTRGNSLAARLDLPDGEPRAYALFAHCFTCSKDLPVTFRISRHLAGRGFAVLRFDFTGLGHSSGDFSETNFSSNIEDLIAAAKHVATIAGEPEILIGHSLGGAAALSAAARLPGLKGVVTIAAPSNRPVLNSLSI